jgi:chaperonin GroEL (HSP60 family)
LYNVNLDFSASEQFSEHVPVAVVARAGEDEEWATSEQSQRAMEELCDEWARLGVGLVASQKRIHPFLKHRLLAMGVVPLERLSIRHIQALHSVIGGKLLGTLKLEAMHVPGARGHLQGMRERVLGGRRYLQLDCDASGSRKKSTLLAWAVDKQAADELEAQLEDVLLLLKHAIKDGAVVPGGGCFEALLAAHLRARVQASEAEEEGNNAETRLLRSMLRECVLLFADVVQRFVASLAPCTLGDAATLAGVEESTRVLLEANTSFRSCDTSQCYWGWKHRCPDPVKVLQVAPAAAVAVGSETKAQKAHVVNSNDNTIIDLALVKRRAIQQAVETAGVILRLDCLFAHTSKSVQSLDVE